MDTRKYSLLFLVGATACVAAIWLPFGFSLTGLIEEWQELGTFTLQGAYFFSDIAHPASDALRPLSHLPFAVAYVLGPNSFASWHILLMLALVVKGCASSQLVHRATGSLAAAMIAGILIVLYPADTMQLSFRSLHINWSLSLALLACSLYAAAWDKRDWGVAILAAAIELSAILIYEAALTCLVIPILLVVARDGARAFASELRARFGLLTIWAASCALYLAYAFWMSGRVSTYQASLLSGGNFASVLADMLPKLFAVGVSRAVFGGWFDAMQMVMTEYLSYFYLVIVTLVLTIFVWIASRRHPLGEQPMPHGMCFARIGRLLCAGMILVAAGYAPYLLSPSHLEISQRTFLFASFGAVLVWIAVFLMAATVTRSAAWLLAVFLIFTGLGAQLVQFHHYVRIAEIQRSLLREIVENFDGNAVNKTLILMDGSNYLGSTWMFIPVNLQTALEYFYGVPIRKIEICHVPSMEWEEPDQNGRKGVCADQGNEWAFRAAEIQPGSAAVGLSKDDAVTLWIGADGTIVPNASLDAYRTNLRLGSSPAAKRYRAVLAESNWSYYQTIFGNDGPEKAFHFSFGRWWSMYLPVRSYGWREAEWTAGMLHHESSAWKPVMNGGLYFDLAPSSTTYSLHLKYAAFAGEEIRKAVRITLNGSDIECNWLSQLECEAQVDWHILRNGANEIRFSSPTDPNYYGLSGKLISFDLVPGK